MNKPQLQSVRRFYLLEYFYVLLKSVEKYSEEPKIFESFKILKQKHRLGESKYKKLTVDDENLSKSQETRYRRTFQLVLEEAQEYALIDVDMEGYLRLTETGKQLLLEYKTGETASFNFSLLQIMERKYNAFRYLIELLYNTNKHKNGLLIFPNYSPRLLHIEKPSIKTTADMIRYSKALVNQLQQDIKTHLGEYRNLEKGNEKLLKQLIENGLLSPDYQAQFALEKYNAIVKKFRDFWRTYFLKEIYQYEYSMSSFEIWTYRGKQIGIIQATDFYPYFHGKIVYPTSVVVKSLKSDDFQKQFEYPDGSKLYIHNPNWHKNQEYFVACLFDAYVNLQRLSRSYFVNLLALRELVCYSMKMPEELFDSFLEEAYKLNLKGQLQIRISLEVDKLPEETQAMYLIQKPVIIYGQSRNIIAIDRIKGEKAL